MIRRRALWATILAAPTLLISGLLAGPAAAAPPPGQGAQITGSSVSSGTCYQDSYAYVCEFSASSNRQVSTPSGVYLWSDASAAGVENDYGYIVTGYESEFLDRGVYVPNGHAVSQLTLSGMYTSPNGTTCTYSTKIHATSTGELNEYGYRIWTFQFDRRTQECTPAP